MRRYAVVMALVGPTGYEASSAPYAVDAQDADAAVREAWDRAEAEYGPSGWHVPYPMTVDGAPVDAEVNWQAVREEA